MTTTRTRTALAVAVLICSTASADYVKASRSTAVRGEPNKDAPVLAAVARGATLLLTDTDQVDAHYHVVVPGAAQVGWVSRFDVRRYPGTPAGLPVEDAWAAKHFGVGKPVLVHERVMEGYASAVDGRLKIPVWVQYEFRPEDLDGPADRSGLGFRIDQRLPPQARAKDDDYTNSGYARGHMAPAEDMSRTDAVMRDSFLMSNCAPQIGAEFNGAIWSSLEKDTRNWVRVRGPLTVITGPIFEPKEVAKPDGQGPSGRVTYPVIGAGGVAVPTHFFKVIVDRQRQEALAFILPNKDLTGKKYADYLTTVGEVEDRAGLDLLSGLPERRRKLLRTEKPADAWPTN